MWILPRSQGHEQYCSSLHGFGVPPNLDSFEVCNSDRGHCKWVVVAIATETH